MSFKYVIDFEEIDFATMSVALYREAWLATKAYHSNNSGENAIRYKRAMDSIKQIESKNDEINKKLSEIAQKVIRILLDEEDKE